MKPKYPNGDLQPATPEMIVVVAPIRKDSINDRVDATPEQEKTKSDDLERATVSKVQTEPITESDA